MAEGEWSLVGVHDVLAAAIPDREMVVCGEVRRTFGEVAARTRGLAAFLGVRLSDQADAPLVGAGPRSK